MDITVKEIIDSLKKNAKYISYHKDLDKEYRSGTIFIYRKEHGKFPLLIEGFKFGLVTLGECLYDDKNPEYCDYVYVKAITDPKPNNIIYEVISRKDFMNIANKLQTACFYLNKRVVYAKVLNYFRNKEDFHVEDILNIIKGT